MSETFQIPIAVAEVYEERFVPAIFAEWAPRLLDAVALSSPDRLLDVACGTGIVARQAAARIGSEHVVGVDLNEAMLTVARRIAPSIDWRQGDVAGLPTDDDAFDVVVCQMAMMFFPDRRRAFAEMARTVRPGGRVGVVVPAALDDQPAYRVFVEVAAERVGPEARSLLGTYWNCGDLDALAADAGDAGLHTLEATTVAGTARFASADDFVATEVASSPLIDRIDAATTAAIGREVAGRLDQYSSGGRFDIPLHCHLLVGRRSSERERALPG